MLARDFCDKFFSTSPVRESNRLVNFLICLQAHRVGFGS
jgi:hypothetical protein